MVVNPDPKPGRWLLPLAILAMFAFTFMFVRTLPRAEIAPQPVTTVPSATTVEEDSSTETTSAAEGEEPDGEAAPEETPTSTTLLPAVVSYLASIEALGEQLTALAREAREVNAAWDERSIEYAETEERLVAVMEDVISWQENVVRLNAPSVLAASHQDMLTASTRAAAAAATVVEGLRSADTGETRRGAAADFNTATTDFVAAVTRAQNTIGG
ncbi:MAG: hypothetical protein OXQ32_03670 [bacterium]|nr:hypothetical protein [bacterium]